MLKEITGNYSPQLFEKQIYDYWLKNNYFHAEVNFDKPPFSMVIPPPNVTGYLHMGHALNNSLQDAVVRYKRMKGFNCTWIPGVDHAGIATQNVVERVLEKEGSSRHEIGREAFVKRVWQWKEEYGSRIISQLKTLGCSCDWQRERFTFDNEYIKAVNKEFVALYNDGLIYRGNYMVNWCPRCQTAVSDIEVEHKEKQGFLWDIKYPLINEDTKEIDLNDYIVVSTTRPETMLGDSAVAVNPKDKRYGHLIGRHVFLPIIKRIIPIISDDFVDMKFGTGAVKVTPSHDPNDFDIGKRHNLPEINIMDERAFLNENAGAYAGFERFKAREAILKQLEDEGYLIGKKNHVSSAGYCSRCESLVEPRISLQWFVSMKELAKPAIEAVKSGQIKFTPKKWEKLYFSWMENIRDWCISRQLWWGHRIPVWYCNDCKEMIVCEEIPILCPKCKGCSLVQDSDVLDTWFSSDMWPFASMGWPKDTEELHYFFPTSLLITAHDIIFFWVARMIMISLYLMKNVPFKEVFINPLVNDSKGRKMSKSKGNTVDPVETIDKFGCDVLRFTLASLTTPGRNLLLGEEKIEGVRNFANKIWNASKFVISAAKESMDISSLCLEALDLNIWDKWILDRLGSAIRNYEKNIEKFNFSLACKVLINFFKNEFCDWYIEAAKIRVYSQNQEEKDTVSYVLSYVLEKYLRLLHPVMPFISEVIWQNIFHEGESIMKSVFPSADKKMLKKLQAENMQNLFQAIGEIRKIRSELNINPGKKIKVYIVSAGDLNDGGAVFIDFLIENKKYIELLCRAEETIFTLPTPKENLLKASSAGVDIYIDLADTVDTVLEEKRLSDEINKLNKEIEKIQAKISNPQFTSKAPKEIVEKEKSKFEEMKAKIEKISEEILKIKELK